MNEPRPRELDVLAESNRLLTSTLDLTEVLDRLADMARTRLETDVARIWLLDEGGAMLHLSAHKGRIRSPLPAKEQVATQASLVGWVFTHGSPLVLADVQQDPRLENRAWFAAEGFASLLCVPIILDDGVIGILSCMTRTRREFSPAEVALAEGLTASAAVAVRNARVHADALRRLAEIQAFQRVASDTLSSPDLVTALEAVVREIQALLRSDAAACSLVDPRTTELKTVTTVGTRVRSLEPARLEPGHGLAGLALQERRPVRTDDYFADARFTRPTAVAEWARAEGVVSMITVPVTDAPGELIALLWAFNRAPRPFTGRDEATLAGLARQAALAMENARLVSDLRHTLDDLKAAQDTLVRGATLRAVGELAAGAAHHLNNLMAVVLGRSQLLLLRNQDPEIGSVLRTIERAALDAADTVRRIQAFSRAGNRATPTEIDLNETVREAVDFTRSRWEHEAQARGTPLEMEFEPGALLPVSGRNAELREVLTNLILNAVDALPEGGRIVIKTWGEPGRAVVSVRDSGAGMAEEVRDRAFEPFFTTKGVRRLGLGLAVAYGLVNGHGGQIALDGGAGKGTTVTFWLPAIEKAEGAPPATAPAAPERRGRILVVDDEADVREVLADVLTSRGHTVTLAGGGREALQCFERGDYDLVITDLAMPDLNGWEVAHAIKAARARLPVLLLTGWADAVDSAAGRVDGVIKKPFDMTKLAAAVSAALARWA
ncbi:MAG TPA: GAF domain-containing protein [Methylomirabilota bacterium]|nr:GAF domain-containing protein [Methylomirabilota bacterium]